MLKERIKEAAIVAFRIKRSKVAKYLPKWRKVAYPLDEIGDYVIL